jgi:outer membrane protein, heavy metal efflux system
MHPNTRTAFPVRRALLAAALIATALGAAAQSPAPAGEPSLKALFDAAWARQPEAQALQARREASTAQRRAAESWTPEPPSLELNHRTDRLLRNDGAREFELGVSVPLWLPDERRRSAALAEAEAAAVESHADGARLRLAAVVREAWWQWQRARIDADIARGQLDSAQRLAADVARRARAGDLARADQHQADGAVAAAESGLAQAEAAVAVALQQVRALAAEVVATVEPTAATGLPTAEPELDPKTTGDEIAVHPALAEIQARASVAERAAALAATKTRANPELTLATTRDRGAAGERYGQTVTLALRIPFGAGARHDSRLAAARADVLEAEAQLAIDRARLQAEQDAARARVEATRVQLGAAERRATLARETRGFFDKSFRLGETDLPMRLRIEAEAAEAERQAARSRIELAAAISSWRQALGLLPQ